MGLNDERLTLLARHEPPGWNEPPACCAVEHDWGPWRAHPNGVNDVRGCRRVYLDATEKLRHCSFSDWREHQHWWGEREAGERSCRMPGCSAVEQS